MILDFHKYNIVVHQVNRLLLGMKVCFNKIVTSHVPQQNRIVA